MATNGRKDQRIPPRTRSCVTEERDRTDVLNRLRGRGPHVAKCLVRDAVVRVGAIGGSIGLARCLLMAHGTS